MPVTYPYSAAGVSVSRFSCGRGADEYTLVIESDHDAGVDVALESMGARYMSALAGLGLERETAVYSRIYHADIDGLKEAVKSSALFRDLGTGAVSVVGQAPVCGGPAAVVSHHLAGGFRREKTAPERTGWQNSVKVAGGNYAIFFDAAFCGDPEAGGSRGQTGLIFTLLAALCRSRGMRLDRDAIRTWIFLRDIESGYAGMVGARREIFDKNGLSEDTRYLASTGIEGSPAAGGALVGIDMLSIGGLDRGQVSRIEAPGHLSRTIRYGVTFERGLRVRFGDRSHLYLSGTASIDSAGRALFPGDPAAQAVRTADNLGALLESEGADLGTLTHLVVYLRDKGDSGAVQAAVGGRFPAGLPVLYLAGRVCRPEWLVEMEGMGIMDDETGYKPFI
jgi:enamine deaminase RidA (YjgF/YER057c/UK114 family)